MQNISIGFEVPEDKQVVKEELMKCLDMAYLKF